MCKIIWTCPCIFTFAMYFTASTKCQRYARLLYFLVISENTNTYDKFQNSWSSWRYYCLPTVCFCTSKKERLYPQLNDMQGARALFIPPRQGMNSHNLRALTEELYWILLQCFKTFNTLTASCSRPRDYCLHNRHTYLILSCSNTECSNHLDHH